MSLCKRQSWPGFNPPSPHLPPPTSHLPPLPPGPVIEHFFPLHVQDQQPASLASPHGVFSQAGRHRAFSRLRCSSGGFNWPSGVCVKKSHHGETTERVARSNITADAQSEEVKSLTFHLVWAGKQTGLKKEEQREEFM